MHREWNASACSHCAPYCEAHHRCSTLGSLAGGDCEPSLARSHVSFDFEDGTLSTTAGLQGEVPTLAEAATLSMSNVEVTFDERAATVVGEYGELIFQLPDLGSTTPIWWYSASLCFATEVCDRMLAP